MTVSIAYLGPAGTYAEQAAINYAQWLMQIHHLSPPKLCAEPSIAQTIYALANQDVTFAVVPVENSIEGGVSFTLDTIWTLDQLVIHQAFILPINHMFISQGKDLGQIKTVYSHPQPLGQCQFWLSQHVPQAQLIPTSSTSEALKYVRTDPTLGAIASERAAKLNQLPIQAQSIQDHPDNCTRFWVLRRKDTQGVAPVKQESQVYTSIAFSVPQNVPGALLAPLKIFAKRQINLSRIESRPAKTALGDYVFFVDAEINSDSVSFHNALAELKQVTKILKLLGCYPIIQFDHPSIMPEA